jgi:acetoin utilization deacetylase AcuC-like enzyme
VRVALITHPSSYQHVGPAGHPERPERVTAAIAGVEAAGLEVVRVQAEPAGLDDLLTVHEAGFITDLERFCSRGGGAIDADTYAVAGSWEAALSAAGAGPTAVAALDGGDADVAFVVVRPPGHHAEAGRAMGFCLFNNIAITAAALAEAGQRVAIVDWDVHHGNGTQQRFYADPNVLYVSIHQDDWYPGTGRLDEVGEGEGRGYTVNLPMPAGAGGQEYAEVMGRVVVPVLEQFGADWMLVSAGYDAHHRDPLAEISLAEEDFAAMAADLSRMVPGGRTVFHLEGGYDLDAVQGSVAATLAGHTGTFPVRGVGLAGAADSINQIVETLSAHWDVV